MRTVLFAFLSLVGCNCASAGKSLKMQMSSGASLDESGVFACIYTKSDFSMLCMTPTEFLETVKLPKEPEPAEGTYRL